LACRCLPGGPLAEGRLTGKYLSGHTGRVTEAGRAYTRVGSDDIARDVVAIVDISSYIRGLCYMPFNISLFFLVRQPHLVL